jgi:hypothetical protein
MSPNHRYQIRYGFPLLLAPLPAFPKRYGWNRSDLPCFHLACHRAPFALTGIGLSGVGFGCGMSLPRRRIARAARRASPR